jgi:hypothetical protein
MFFGKTTDETETKFKTYMLIAYPRSNVHVPLQFPYAIML